jgi:hypothetical protein
MCSWCAPKALPEVCKPASIFGTSGADNIERIVVGRQREEIFGLDARSDPNAESGRHLGGFHPFGELAPD